MNSWVEELRELLGDYVSTDPEVLAAHAADKWHAAVLPEAVLLASETEQVAAAMKFAAERGIPVTPRGAGVGYVGGCVPVKGGACHLRGEHASHRGGEPRGWCGRGAGRGAHR